MATFKHISSKNADYGAAEQYLTFEHDEFTMKPTLDGNGRLVLRDDYRISSLNCGDEDFAIACMRSNLKYGKNQKREDVKSHHYIISFDPRDAPDNGLTVDRAQQLGEQFCKEHFPGHQAYSYVEQALLSVMGLARPFLPGGQIFSDGRLQHLGGELARLNR